MASSYTIAFTVHGRPVRWERTSQDPRSLRRHHFEKKAVTAGKADVAEAFVEALEDLGYPDQLWPWEGPCSLRLRYVYQAPKDSWPGFECVKTPDLDNLAKLVQDALNGVAYRDDRQLVRLEVERVYGQREHSSIELRFWSQPPKPPAPPRAKKPPQPSKRAGKTADPSPELTAALQLLLAPENTNERTPK